MTEGVLTAPQPAASRTTRLLLFHLGVPLAIGLLLGSSKAGIANFLPWGLGVAYWTALSLGMWGLAHLATTAVAALLRPWRPPWLLVVTVGFFVASVPARFLIYAFTPLFNPYMLGGRTARPLPPMSLDWGFVAQYLELWSGICVLWIGANYVFDRFVGLPRYRYDLEPLRATRPVPAARPAAPGPGDAGAPGSPTPAESAAPAVPAHPGVAADPGGAGVGAVPPLLARLPAHLGTRLVALKAEDHYVLVHTEAGKALVLYRLSDAINELQALRGLRVHRSYWVNLDAVTGTEVTARGCFALMKNGLRVPISASYREAARAAGLLAD